MQYTFTNVGVEIMLTSKLVLVGLSDLLMNNPMSMLEPQSTGRKVIPEPAVEAKPKRYLTEDGKYLCMTSEILRKTIVNGSRGFRITGKSAATPFIAGSMEIIPENIPLCRPGEIMNGGAIGPKIKHDDYEIDRRTVVVQKARIVRSRPRVGPWALECEIHFDEEWLLPRFMNETFREILKRAGVAIGSMDYRPQKMGRFGRWGVASYVIAGMKAPIIGEKPEPLISTPSVHRALAGALGNRENGEEELVGAGGVATIAKKRGRPRTKH